MITRRVKVQLLVFAVITLLGTTFVGGRYAQIDRLVVDRTFPVSVDLPNSGGSFTDAEVTYRGVGVGRVGALELTDDGVDAVLDIEKDAPRIPADVVAVVANKSAVGEQYIDLQPRSAGRPFLESGSTIPRDRTAVPLDTTTFLSDVNSLVTSVDKQDLRTVVGELGTAFNGTGRDLGRIIDTSNAFIETADENFDVTAELIRNSNRVLQTQIDAESDIESFSRDLRDFSETLRTSDGDLRAVLDRGPRTAAQVRRLVAENADDLGTLLRNLRTTNRIAVARLDGIRGVLILYPYVVEGAWTVVEPDGQGNYDAHFGLVFTTDPHICDEQEGYRQMRLPADRDPMPFTQNVECVLPAGESVPRASKNAEVPQTSVERVAPGAAGSPATTVGVYDEQRGTLDPVDALQGQMAMPATRTVGEDAWKWLLLGPAAAR